MNLYLLSPPKGSFIPDLPELFEAGVDWFQYRRPDCSDRVKREEIKRVVTLSRRHDVKVFVNDRPDLALSTGAYGVHVGSDDLNPVDIKSEWPDLHVGVTQRVDESLVESADYYSVGPVFEPESKALDKKPCGWEGVENVISRTEKPVFAIGGITGRNVKQAPKTLSGVAVISAVWDDSDPSMAVERFCEQIP